MSDRARLSTRKVYQKKLHTEKAWKLFYHFFLFWGCLTWSLLRSFLVMSVLCAQKNGINFFEQDSIKLYKVHHNLGLHGTARYFFDKGSEGGGYHQPRQLKLLAFITHKKTILGFYECSECSINMQWLMQKYILDDI